MGDNNQKQEDRRRQNRLVETPTKELDIIATPIDILNDSSRRTPFNQKRESTLSSQPMEISTSPTSIISPALPSPGDRG